MSYSQFQSTDKLNEIKVTTADFQIKCVRENDFIYLQS